MDVAISAAVTKKSFVVRVGVVAVVVAVLGVATYVLLPGPRQKTVVAYFTSTTSVYAGDDVRVFRGPDIAVGLGAASAR
jgi:ABC-type transporter Mla subunit MlaD